MTHQMHVFGAGMGRTGTTSVQRALAQLGYRAYNFESVIQENHFETWGKIFSGEIEPDWPALFTGYDATIAWPPCFFYKELMTAYPEAKFILTTRDPERWADSLLAAYKVIASLRSFRFIPKVRAMTDVMDGGMRQRLFGDEEMRREAVMQAFINHNEAVQRDIPAERLLVYEVQQGWEPLCDFLEKPVPDTPFPHANKREDFRQMALRLFGIRT